jgi:toxin ParE1/3/4
VLEWRAAARADLLAIVEFISDDNPAAAQRLKDDIEERVGKLPEHPKLNRAGRVAGTREMVVRPNYTVIYKEDPVPGVGGVLPAARSSGLIAHWRRCFIRR